MGLAGGPGERAGHQQHIGVQGPVKLGKTQVVANAQTDLVDMAINRGQIKTGRLAARLQHAGFVVGFLAPRKPEQVHLVVARHAGARGCKSQRRIADTVRVLRGQRQCAAHNPEAKRFRRMTQKILDRAVADGFARRQLVGVPQTHDAKVFGQQRQLGPLCGGLMQQVVGARQVGLHAGSGDHLNRCQLHEISSRSENGGRIHAPYAIEIIAACAGNDWATGLFCLKTCSPTVVGTAIIIVWPAPGYFPLA